MSGPDLCFGMLDLQVLASQTLLTRYKCIFTYNITHFMSGSKVIGSSLVRILLMANTRSVHLFARLPLDK